MKVAGRSCGVCVFGWREHDVDNLVRVDRALRVGNMDRGSIVPRSSESPLDVVHLAYDIRHTNVSYYRGLLFAFGEDFF